LLWRIRRKKVFWISLHTQRNVEKSILMNKIVMLMFRDGENLKILNTALTITTEINECVSVWRRLPRWVLNTSIYVFAPFFSPLFIGRLLVFSAYNVQNKNLRQTTLYIYTYVCVHVCVCVCVLMTLVVLKKRKKKR